MYLYTDQNMQDQVYGEKTTPAHLYEGINNFSIILEDMFRGAIPFNTKQMYPTIWKADEHLIQQPQYLNNPYLK